jgi:hypothetical protein
MDDITAQLEDGAPGGRSVQAGHFHRVGRKLPYTSDAHYVVMYVHAVCLCYLPFISKWLYADMIQCHDACCSLPSSVLNTTSCWKVLLADECTVCDACDRNVVFCG